MELDEEGIARTKGVNPAARRLQLGMSAVVRRQDGAVVEMFPDGREDVLHAPKELTERSKPNSSESLRELGF